MLAYLDTAIWITRVEGHPAYKAIIETRLEELKDEGWEFCISQAVMMEVLYKPYRTNNYKLIDIYTDLFAKAKIFLNYPNLLDDALRIMHTEHLKAMDAIHVALAWHYDCEGFITTDTDFLNLKRVPLFWINLVQVS